MDEPRSDLPSAHTAPWTATASLSSRALAAVGEAARELLTLAALATALGVVSVASRSDELPWIADPAAAAGTCELGPAPSSEAPESSAALSTALSRVERITFRKALSYVGDPTVTFVDARSSAQYEHGHIPGALSLPAAEAESVLAFQSFPLPLDRLVICYCDGWSCEQSESLGRILQDTVGCQRVRVLEGGWQRWTMREGPVERGKVADHG